MNGVQRGIKALAICFAIFLIINIFGWIVFGVSFLINISGSSTEEKSEIQSFENDKQIYIYTQEQCKNINRIEIDTAYSDLYIVRVSNPDITIESNSKSKNNLDIRLSNDTLKIAEEEIWFWDKQKIGEIKIYIPENIVLEALNIDTGAGKARMEGISAKKLKLNHGAGKLEIVNSEFNKADIDAGAGKAEIFSSILNDLNLDAGVGKVEINSRITGRSEIECGVGEVDITLNGNKDDYRIIAEKGIGSIRIDGIEQSDNINFGNGENYINIEGGIRRYKG